MELMTAPAPGGLRPGDDLPVSALVRDSVAWVDAEATLLEVADELSAAEVGMLLVGTAPEVRAVISERDLVHALATRQDPATTTAGEIGHGNLVCCGPEATVAEAAVKMMHRYVRHLLVIDTEGALVGVVSARDLLGAYAAWADEADPDGDAG